MEIIAGIVEWFAGDEYGPLPAEAQYGIARTSNGKRYLVYRKEIKDFKTRLTRGTILRGTATDDPGRKLQLLLNVEVL